MKNAAFYRIHYTIHQQGQTDYPTFCEQAADTDVDTWTTND